MTYFTITSRKTNRFAGHAAKHPHAEGMVLVYEGGWTTGRMLTKEQARAEFVLGKPVSAEKSKELEDRRQWELNR